MTPRVFDSLVAALIRIGLLLALVIMLMAENAQEQPTRAQAGSNVSGIRVRSAAQPMPEYVPRSGRSE